MKIKVMAAVFIIAGVISWAYNYEETHPVRPAVMYEVEEGDTLWSIASEYSNDSQDIREVYYRIMKENNVDSGHLRPGQTLIIHP